ncbi:DUF6887 family protein [Anabaena lutea]
MTNINFNTMTIEQLRKYLKMHPKDQGAFYIYMD